MQNTMQNTKWRIFQRYSAQELVHIYLRRAFGTRVRCTLVQNAQCKYISQVDLPAIFLLVKFWREERKCRTSNFFAGKELVRSYVRGVGGIGKRERRRFFYRSYVGISTRYQQFFCWLGGFYVAWYVFYVDQQFFAVKNLPGIVLLLLLWVEQRFASLMACSQRYASHT